MSKRILLVEDDLNLGFLLMESLNESGYQVKLCKDGLSGWKQFKKEPYDLCILDVMMPGLDGFTLGKKIKDENDHVPIIYLTAKSDKEDKLIGFKAGAEDYITKPFDLDELECRLKVIFRRTEGQSISDNSFPISIGKYSFDFTKQLLTFDDEKKRLTQKENEILALLVKNQNRILKREDAVRLIYGKEDYFLGRSFDVFISRLRKLLAKDKSINIENVFKVGFILHTPANLS